MLILFVLIFLVVFLCQR